MDFQPYFDDNINILSRNKGGKTQKRNYKFLLLKIIFKEI